MRRMLLSCLAGLAFLFSLSAGAADTTSKTTLTIKGMTCGGCVAAVKLQLRKTDGVTAFKGCSEGVCGIRGRNPQAVVQPGAKIGDLTYCSVSGAVFRIKESSQR